MTYTITATGKATIEHDPDAVLDYVLDLTAWLTDVSDTLQSLTMLSTGVTVDSSSISGNLCIAWISGGTVGEPASATFRFTTAGGRTDDRTINFKIKER